MDAEVMRSLKEGQRSMGKGFSCQALVCAATTPESLTDFFAYVAASPRYQYRTCLFVAYRFPTTEGFQESEEIAASQKLLHLLQRMGVENIIVGVVLWTDLTVQNLGTDMYRAVCESARTLLEVIHSEVILLRRTEIEQRKQSFLELPPINAEKWQTPRSPKRKLNMSVDIPYSSESTQRIPDPEYEASYTTLRNTAKQVTIGVVGTLQKYSELKEVATLLQLLLILLSKVAKKCSDSTDLLVGNTLRIAMLNFKPAVLTSRQLALAQNLQRKLDEFRVGLHVASEVSLLSNWTKTALRLCGQPTLQALRSQDDQPDNEYQFSSAMTVREGRFGTPTQFVFDNNRTKQLALQVKHSVRKKKLGQEKPGLAQLADLILEKKKEEEAWGQQIQVAEVKGLDLDPDLESRLLEARKQQMKQEERINRLIHLHLEDLRVGPDTLRGIPDADVYRYIDTTDFHDLPTGLLMAFAAKLKERRKRRQRRRTIEPL